MSDINLYESPDVPNDVQAFYTGGVSYEVFAPDSPDASMADRSATWAQACTDLLEGLRAEARALCANSVLGVVIEFCSSATDPQTGQVGLWMGATGTSAILKPVTWAKRGPDRLPREGRA